VFIQLFDVIYQLTVFLLTGYSHLHTHLSAVSLYLLFPIVGLQPRFRRYDIAVIRYDTI